MQRAERARTNDDIRIARAGESTKILPFEEGVTVEDWLDKAGISLSSSEEVYVESEKVDLDGTCKLEAGDLVQIVGKKEGGQK